MRGINRTSASAVKNPCPAGTSSAESVWVCTSFFSRRSISAAKKLLSCPARGVPPPLHDAHLDRPDLFRMPWILNETVRRKAKRDKVHGERLEIDNRRRRPDSRNEITGRQDLRLARMWERYPTGQ